MKKFLFPTDFSDHANATFEYALGFTQAMNASLSILHVMPPVVATVEYHNSDNELNLDEKRVRWAKDHLATYTAQAEKRGVSIHSIIETGNPISEIVSRNEHFDLIIMGTRGVRKTEENPIGNVTGGVIQLSEIPVMTIPEDIIFEPFDHVMYASEKRMNTPENLGFMANIIDKFHPRISFTHINQEVEDENFVYESVEQVYENETSSHQTGWYTFNQSDILSGLESFAINKDVDLMVMKTHKRNFWERLFEESLSKEMALNIRMPLLILKESDQ